MSGLAVDWTKHLKDPEARKALEDSIRHSTVALGRLKAVIKEKIAVLHRAETSSEDYNNPGWAYRQADRNGRKAALKDLNDLLSFLGD